MSRIVNITSGVFVVAVVVAGFIAIRGAWKSDSHPSATSSMASSSTGVSRLDPDNPCGIVAIAVATHAIGKPTSLANVRASTPRATAGQHSMADLVDGLRRLGCGAEGVRLGGGHLQVGQLPIILALSDGHYVVAIQDKDGVVIVDPPRAVKLCGLRELSSRWNGECIVVASSTSELAIELGRLGIGGDAVP